MMKCKIGHWKNEKKGEFGNPWNDSLSFKCSTPIMLGPTYKYLISITFIKYIFDI